MQTIAIDFDGVIHSYSSGWTGPIPFDEPVPGAREFIEAHCVRYHIVVHSSRASDDVGKTAIWGWLKHHKFPIREYYDNASFGSQSGRIKTYGIVEVTATKPKASLYIDDRGWRFQGDWDNLTELLTDSKNLLPWNKDHWK